MAAFEFLSAMVIAVVWMGAYAQLLGMPVAWLRLRRTPAWEGRPDDVRRIDLLAKFILGPTILTIAWGWLVLIVATFGGIDLSGGALLMLMWGAPVLFVPWTVLCLNKDHFSHVVESVRQRKLAKRTRVG